LDRCIRGLQFSRVIPEDRRSKISALRNGIDRAGSSGVRARDDDMRSGWISGYDEELSWCRPTAGGLRIGKPLKERNANEALDDRLEWDRDGQYFHYLTKWIHALCQAAFVTGELNYFIQ
jgi:hypothetical protein